MNSTVVICFQGTALSRTDELTNIRTTNKRRNFQYIILFMLEKTKF